jgi:hypothetical protein
MPDLNHAALLGAFAALAGLVDAVVGGGGLIQIPALFLLLPAGDAAVVAAVLGTNKFSSFCGTSIALIQYARRIRLNWGSLLPAAVSALVFSFLGARVVTLLQPEFLRPLVLLLLVAVAGYTFLRKDLGSRHTPAFTARRERLLGVLAGAAIGFYDGFFGPGTGSFLIFVFVGWFGFDFLTASASAKVINCATNLSAIAYFAATDHVLWRFALPMAVCNVLGSMAGSRLALRKGNRFVRWFFLVIVSAMIGRFGWEVLFAAPR